LVVGVVGQGGCGMRAYNAIKIGSLEIGFLCNGKNEPVFKFIMGDPFDPDEQEVDSEDLKSIETFIRLWKPFLKKESNG
jgi:hypothetical protein